MYDDVILVNSQDMSTAAVEMYSKTLQGAMLICTLRLRRSSQTKEIVFGIIAQDAQQTMNYNNSA